MSCEAGSSTLELALLLPVMLLLFGGALSFGHAYYTAIEVSSAAEAGAMYGLSHPSDTVGMVKAAQLDAPDVPSIAAAATWGCECADGTSVSVSCTNKPLCLTGLVTYVDVSTSATESALVNFNLPWSSINFSGHSHMRLTQ